MNNGRQATDNIKPFGYISAFHYVFTRSSSIYLHHHQISLYPIDKDVARHSTRHRKFLMNNNNPVYIDKCEYEVFIYYNPINTTKTYAQWLTLLLLL